MGQFYVKNGMFEILFKLCRIEVSFSSRLTEISYILHSMTLQNYWS